MRTALCSLLLSLLASINAQGAAKVITEGIPSSLSTILVSTRTGRTLVTGLRVSSATHMVGTLSLESSGTFKGAVVIDGHTQAAAVTSSSVTASALRINGHSQFQNVTGSTATFTGLKSSGHSELQAITATTATVTGIKSSGHSELSAITAATATITGLKNSGHSQLQAVTATTITARGIWIEVSSATLAGVGLYKFSGLNIDRNYRLEWNCTMSAGANSCPQIYFNDDAAPRYIYGIVVIDSGGGLGSTNVSSSSGTMVIGDCANELDDVGYSRGALEFATVPSTGTVVVVSGLSHSGVTPSGSHWHATGGGRYSGPSNLSSVTIWYRAAGLCNGYFSLLERRAN